MKNLLFIFLIVTSVLFTQILNAQSRKEKRKAKKLKGKVEQVDTPGKQNTNTDKPVPTISTDTISNINGKVPQGNNVSPNIKNPSTSSSQRNPQQGDIDINAITNNSRPIVTEKPNGSVNWTDQFIEAKGYSVIDTSKFKNLAQAKAWLQEVP